MTDEGHDNMDFAPMTTQEVHSLVGTLAGTVGLTLLIVCCCCDVYQVLDLGSLAANARPCATTLARFISTGVYKYTCTLPTLVLQYLGNIIFVIGIEIMVYWM
ncbi:hypothetical protein QE152_g32576 [Popillia japonica]|uniref:Uncharacterized protein n=1 Tax=Popillia japonica TaxID=7064 RepID=A0AAW1IYE9_POPJA